MTLHSGPKLEKVQNQKLYFDQFFVPIQVSSATNNFQRSDPTSTPCHKPHSVCESTCTSPSGQDTEAETTTDNNAVVWRGGHIEAQVRHWVFSIILFISKSFSWQKTEHLDNFTLREWSRSLAQKQTMLTTEMGILPIYLLVQDTEQMRALRSALGDALMGKLKFQR